MASRKIEDLKPELQVLVNKWLEMCKENQLDVLIYCTYRSNEEQNQLYSIGRTKPGKKVTNAAAGKSAHNYGCALDFVPLVAGKPQWNDRKLYNKAINLALSLGLESLRDSSFPELAHLQLKDWKIIN